MKLKKLLYILVACIASVAIFLSACDSDNVVDSSVSDSSTSESSSESEYTLELEEGCKQLTIYYYRAAGYENCDIWMWCEDGDNLYGQVFHECEYGAKVVVNVPEETEAVGFIIRTNCSDPGGTEWGTATKDATEDDRYVTLTDTYTVIYTKAGDANSYTSTDGGKTLTKILSISLADMRTLNQIMYTFSSNYKITSLDEISVKDNDGNSVNVTRVSSLNQNTTVGIVYVDTLDITKAYTLDIGGVTATVIPKTYFSSSDFEDEYYYDGDLGVTLASGSTSFRLWAPTASKVTLNLFEAGNGGEAYETADLAKGEKGVWSYTAGQNLNGKYYTYTVTTGYGTQEAVDPYAVSAGVNGQRGMILDLDSTDPDGWTTEPFDNPEVENYTDAEIWEVQVRDFSIGITSATNPGKFLAFTETGLTQNGHAVGIDYLKNLGITHVHLMPSYDFASVDETKTGDNAEYNWGYDPQNYNVPEGSYSTDPYNGEVRVNEFKQMVQALHNAGISVVMDVVYNHTYDSNSNLNKVVPYYYYRYTTTGALSNGSGCGNETASDRAMYSKYMVDSVTYWQKEYNLDGFRFDLMGLHDTETMQKIEEAVHEINSEAIIYGEGWTGGTTTLSTSSQSILSNLQTVNSNNDGNGIAMFNDVIRDGIKGSVFDIDEVGFATGANTDKTSDIIFAMRGSVNAGDSYKNGNGWYAANPTQVINYASAHDNNTLWDRICYVYGTEESTLEARLKRNALSAAIVQTSLGIPFMMAGEELLRSKVDSNGDYVSDSYNAGDSVNMIDWSYSGSSSQAKMYEYYKGLIAFRKSSPTLRSASYTDGTNVVCTVDSQTTSTLIVMEMTALDNSETLLVVYNASENDATITLDGSWDLYVSGMQAGASAIESGISGTQTVAGISCSVYKKVVKA
ncbi:MAG: type I pullulanase [Clostridia bacterium]|nr:type I pullulanase [Clostridia bacterium]